MTPDPAAVEAAARALETEVRKFPRDPHGFGYMSSSSWGISLHDCADAALTAAMPLIEAQVREGVAREIEDASARDIGVRLDVIDVTYYLGCSDAQRGLARIARGAS